MSAVAEIERQNLEWIYDLFVSSLLEQLRSWNPTKTIDQFLKSLDYELSEYVVSNFNCDVEKARRTDFTPLTAFEHAVYQLFVLDSWLASNRKLSPGSREKVSLFLEECLSSEFHSLSSFCKHRMTLIGVIRDRISTYGDICNEMIPEKGTISFVEFLSGPSRFHFSQLVTYSLVSEYSSRLEPYPRPLPVMITGFILDFCVQHHVINVSLRMPDLIVPIKEAFERSSNSLDKTLFAKPE